MRKGRSRRRWIKDGGDQGFYLEILPEEWTKSWNDTENIKFLAKPPMPHLPKEVLTECKDFPPSAYKYTAHGQEERISQLSKNDVKGAEYIGGNATNATAPGIHFSDDKMFDIYRASVPEISQHTALMF